MVINLLSGYELRKRLHKCAGKNIVATQELNTYNCIGQTRVFFLA